jgi:hypothetical protein
VFEVGFYDILVIATKANPSQQKEEEDTLLY